LPLIFLNHLKTHMKKPTLSCTVSRYFLFFAILLALFANSSCSSSKGWVYGSGNVRLDRSAEPNEKILGTKTIKVLPFSDRRDPSNNNSILLYLIPFMPFGMQDLNSPESVPMHINSGLWVNYNPKEDFAKAIVDDLRSLDLFDDVAFSYSKKGSDYFIEGDIISTKYSGKMITYGLSVYGPALWIAGLPASYVENDLQVKLRFIRTKNKKVIFEKTYSANKYKKLGWIYNLPNDFNYADMLKEVNEQFLNDMLKSLKKD